MNTMDPFLFYDRAKNKGFPPFPAVLFRKVPNPLHPKWSKFNQFNAAFEGYRTSYKEKKVQVQKLCSKSKQPQPVDPIWKRRGAKPITPLKLDLLICCNMSWVEKVQSMPPFMQIVYDTEWVTRERHFEAHTLIDQLDGVVIDPPCFPRWYKEKATGRNLKAYTPFPLEYLMVIAKNYNYTMDRAITMMGNVVGLYAQSLIHPTRRGWQETLVLAGNMWQGVAAISAAIYLRKQTLNVSVYLHEGSTNSKEEEIFKKIGGKVYKNLKDLKGKVFRVVIVALENQFKNRFSILPMFGEWLQHSVAVFVDPPVLKCGYSTALQYACRGAYNISQKTVIFVPSLPKTYMIDAFVDVYVVDVGVPRDAYASQEMEYFNFQGRSVNIMCAQVLPQPFKVEGSKIHHYRNGEPID